jgi:geranylgeranyl diphosphate synthase type II
MPKTNILTSHYQLDSLPAFQKRINHFLDDYFTTEIHNAQQIDSHYRDLWQVMYEVTQAGGKRLRPYLVLLGYATAGGEDFLDILAVAAAQELLHQCLLIHDDIIDRDDIRHGVLNVTGRFKKIYQHADQAHYASSAAILAGDLLLSGSYQLVNESSYDPKIKAHIVRRMGEAMYSVGAGELLDTESAMQPIGSTDAIKIARLKTASYSFVIPLLCGAELVSANPITMAALREFGENLGIAYQLKDDLLGIFGNEQRTGKSSSNDIREGKHTLIMQLAIERAGKAESQILQRELGNQHISTAKLEQIKAIVVDCGAQHIVLQKIDDYLGRAQSAIEVLSMSPQLRVEFDVLIARLRERTA